MTDDTLEVLSRNTTKKRHITDGSLIVNQSELQTITDAMGEGLLVVDSQGAFAFMNPAAECLLGWTLEEVKGKHVHNTIHYMKEDGSPFPVDECKMYENAFNKKTESRETDVLIKKDGTFLPIEYTATPIMVDQSTHNVVIVFRDITKQKEEQERIWYLAMHDELTGLPNRFYFRQMLTEKIAEAKKSHHLLGILLLDIDRFKYVNDSLGHDTGDALLQETAKRIKSISSRLGATVARMGGDEFLIMTAPFQNKEKLHNIGASIITGFSQPINANGVDFHITPSVGISVFPEHGEDEVTLIKHADVAMYSAKKQRNQYKIYESEMNRKVIEILHLEYDLRQAFERGALQLHYQPQIHIENYECVGVEALLRWKHHEKGWIPPAKFIPLAEETGLIFQIDRRTLLQACRQMRHWIDQGMNVQRISVNISNKLFHSGMLVETVQKVLEETQLDPNLLELEFTENVTMYGETTTCVMRDLKKIGVHISIDDFGTGYSSLSNLKNLPFDRLKIDQSFIHGITPGSKEAAIVSAIASMSHSLGIGVIAEGVETKEELEFVRSLACYEVQGYYFSKPLPVREFERYLQKCLKKSQLLWKKAN